MQLNICMFISIFVSRSTSNFTRSCSSCNKNNRYFFLKVKELTWGLTWPAVTGIWNHIHCTYYQFYFKRFSTELSLTLPSLQFFIIVVLYTNMHWICFEDWIWKWTEFLVKHCSFKWCIKHLKQQHYHNYYSFDFIFG